MRRIKWEPISFLQQALLLPKDRALSENKWFLMNNCSNLKWCSTSFLSLSTLAAVKVDMAASALPLPEITCQFRRNLPKSLFLLYCSEKKTKCGLLFLIKMNEFFFFFTQNKILIMFNCNSIKKKEIKINESVLKNVDFLQFCTAWTDTWK